MPVILHLFPIIVVHFSTHFNSICSQISYNILISFCAFRFLLSLFILFSSLLDILPKLHYNRYVIIVF